MDVKGAFDHVSRTQLTKRMEELDTDPQIIQWTNSFITDRKASLVINGHESAMTPTQTGIPQGSPVSPIISAIYNSGVFDEVEEAVLGATGHCHYRFCAWLRRIRACLQFSCVKYQRDGVQKFCEKYKRVVLSGFSLFEVEDCAPPKRKIAGKQQERSASKKGKGKA
jgi:hypothetical protein